MKKKQINYKKEYNDIYLIKTKLNKPFTYWRYTVLRSRGHSLKEIIKMKRQSFDRWGYCPLKLNNRQIKYLKEYINVEPIKNLAKILWVSYITILNYKKRLWL